MRLDIAHRVIVFAGRLQRRVHAPMGKIEEEGAVPVGLDDLQGFIGPVISEIAVGSEPVAGIIRRRIAHPRPQELVDRVEVQPGIHNVRIILRQEQAAGHQQAFVEALGGRPRCLAAAQMPLADMDRVIALRFEHLRNRHFIAGQALPFIVGRQRSPLGVIVDIRQARHDPWHCRPTTRRGPCPAAPE